MYYRMGAFFDFCKSIPKPIPILGKGIDTYTAIDLGSGNMELSNFNIGDYTECQRYIDTVLERNRAEVAHGGYLEKRKLYDDILNFGAIGQTRRNIHLGIDFWSEAGTEVLAPLKGWVHSYRNNRSSGDYGPTIILGHKIGSLTFYTLYGHLSVSSLKGLYEGKKIGSGHVLGELGTPKENVNYAPHLHFQVILDLGDYRGDYPGVCSSEDVEFYAKNCPDPNLILGIGE